MLFNEYGQTPIEEASQSVVYIPEMIPVVKLDEGYYTEMDFLVPYMESAGIEYISDALDNIAFAHGMNENAVGLLIDQDCSDAVYEMACALSESGIPVAYKCINEYKDIDGITVPETEKENREMMNNLKPRNAEQYKAIKDYQKKQNDYRENRRNATRYYKDKDVGIDAGVYDNYDHNRAGKKAEKAFKDYTKARRKNDTAGEQAAQDRYAQIAKPSVNATRQYFNRLRNSTAVHKQATKHGYKPGSKEYDVVSDSVNRHNRRHPDRKLESAQNLREAYGDDYDAYFDDTYCD